MVPVTCLKCRKTSLAAWDYTDARSRCPRCGATAAVPAGEASALFALSGARLADPADDTAEWPAFNDPAAARPRA